jgi:hypothetical protein
MKENFEKDAVLGGPSGLKEITNPEEIMKLLHMTREQLDGIVKEGKMPMLLDMINGRMLDGPWRLLRPDYADRVMRELNLTPEELDQISEQEVSALLFKKMAMELFQNGGKPESAYEART